MKRVIFKSMVQSMAKSQTVQVIEYETIAISGGKHSVNKEMFKELETLILEMQETQHHLAIDFLSLSAKKSMGKIIRAKNYVGVLQLPSGNQVQILPKIHNASRAASEEESKQILMKMLKTLRDFPSKTFSETNLSTLKMPLFEIFIKLYLQEMIVLVKKGLQSAYYATEDNVRIFKGKMNFSKQLQHNSIHKERFYVVYDEFGLNRPENRLIKSTLLKLSHMARHDSNRKEIKRLLSYFEVIEPSQNIDKDFQSLRLERNMTHYKKALDWSKVFLKNQNITSFTGNVGIQSLLFPMEQIFENYVGYQIKQMAPSNWEVTLQKPVKFLFEEQFKLKPDIIMLNSDDARCIILDTKWKRLNPELKNYGISQSDMYQMYAYAKKYMSNEIYLLYPMTDQFHSNQRIEFKSDDGVIVYVVLIDCLTIEESLKDLVDSIIKSK